jgi:aquaporin Z
MLNALKQHWPEYLIEAAGLGLFMISACVFGAVLEYPGSPVRQAIHDPMSRRVLMGLAMGATAVAIIYSPWGKRSGAHINPAVTLTFLRLDKVARPDAFFYVSFQFIGAIVGTGLAALALGGILSHPSVNYVATMPGRAGPAVAFFAEVSITFVLMMVILTVSNLARVARYTGVCAALLVAIYISFEAPLSGMSMNPARTFGSAVVAQAWGALWVYFTAPPLGMLLAAEVYLRLNGARAVLCAKLHHHNQERCIFNCNFGRCGNAVHVGAARTLS